MELKHILDILWRRKWLVINNFAAIFLTIVIGTLLIPPWYDSTARMLLRKSSASSSVLASIGLSGGSGSVTLDETDRADYLALSTLRPVAEKVVSELNVKRVRTRTRLMNAVPGLKPVLRFVGVDVNATEEVMTAEDLLDSSLTSFIFPRPYVSVEQYEETNIIDIEAISPDPEQAMRIANAMAKNFIDEELKRVREDYAGAKEFIDNNIVKAKHEYLDALNATKDFKEREKFANLDSETINIIQKISDLKKSIEDNKLAIYKTKASINNIESQLKSIPKYQKSSEQLKDNEMILSLKMTLRDLYLSLAETRTKYTKDHPSVMDIENKIAQTKELLQKEMGKVFGSETVSIDAVYQNLTEKLAVYYADLSGYESQNKALPSIITRYEADMMKLPKQVSDYSNLQLAVTVTQDIYNSLLKYQYQIGMAESTALSNIYVVEPAITPKIGSSKHKTPNLLLNALFAIMLGATFGISVALFVEYIDDTIKTPEDVRAFKGLTFLGSIFNLKKKDPRLISMSDPRFPLREFIRTIRNSIKFTSLDKTLKSITITSSIDQEGKSFFAANLAISAANEGKKVLIIDCDLRRPGINNYFNLPKNLGLTSYMVGDQELKDIQLKSGIEGLSIILTGPIPPDPGKLVESNKMHNLIKDMEMIYDLVIIDTPPVLAASDAIVLGGWTDGSIILIQSGRASRSHFSDIIETFKRANINLIGAVLNRVHGRTASYYYYYK
ncbi:MAG: polysaccharide biosynthesis tyrosine autokinase [Deltaproteobacteria bacterium]|nr:polysaccharide biosynthesis tyrosine autokinase [Deltaproteobacteria bacterium]